MNNVERKFDAICYSMIMKYISIILLALTLGLFGCEPEAKTDAPVVSGITRDLQTKPVVGESDLTKYKTLVSEPKVQEPVKTIAVAPTNENTLPEVNPVIADNEDKGKNKTESKEVVEDAILWTAPKFDTGIGPNAENTKLRKYIWRSIDLPGTSAGQANTKTAVGVVNSPEKKPIENGDSKPVADAETPDKTTPPIAEEDSKDKTLKKDDKKSGPSLEDTAFFKNCDFVFKNFVDKNGKVNYLRLRRKKIELLAAVRELGNIPMETRLSWSDNDKKAFLLNAHNILMIKLIIDNYPIKGKWWATAYPKSSIKQIPGARTKKFFRIATFRYTIDEVEVELLDLAKDPKYCFALSNATVTGGKLRNEAYHPDKLDKQIDEQVKKYLSDPKNLKINTSEKKIHLSSMIKMKNFKKSFLNSKYAKIMRFREKTKANRAFLNFIFLNIDKKSAKEIESPDYKIEFENYDWLLNEK